MNNLAGFLLINKPKNITSYDCIRHIKKILYKNNIKNLKIGHTGTLDPFATGLLIIAIGKEYTKKCSYFINFDKKYIAKAKLGILTDSLDLTGNIKDIKENFISKNELEKAINHIIKNKYLQEPPIYSALKFKGKKLCDLARKNRLSQDEFNYITKSKKREVLIKNIRLLNYEYPNFEIYAHVSSGTYIRTLINDIAQIINSYAVTEELSRIAIDKYNLKDSINLYNLSNLENIEKNLIL